MHRKHRQQRNIREQRNSATQATAQQRNTGNSAIMRKKMHGGSETNTLSNWWGHTQTRISRQVASRSGTSSPVVPVHAAVLRYVVPAGSTPRQEQNWLSLMSVSN
jgi:hypothetical protein